MQRHLIIFTRYPKPNKTKTRLIPALGPDGAAALQCEMTLHTLRWAGRLRSDSALSVEVRFEGGDEARMRDRFGNGFSYRPQGPGDLGCRLARAVQEGCRSGAQRIVIIGTDCPDISPQLVLAAFDRLASSDIVLGPATDGGYYLIGLRQPIYNIFSEISWGSERVFHDTLTRAAECSLSVSLLKTLSDVDRPEDIAIWQRIKESGTETPPSRISVVIPVLNEAAYLEDTLLALSDAENIETIVVDGGSRDGTDDLAAATATRLLRSPSGRARQMNLGAAAATGDILLFLHADTRVPHRFDTHIRAALNEPSIVAGAFQLHIDGPERTLRLIEWGTNLRSRYLRMPYGDQALFLRAETFRRMGGFRDLPIMEDFEFARRLRRSGRLAIVPQEVVTSARRWHTLGPWRTTWTNQLIIVSYLLGMSVDRLARWYSQPQPAAERQAVAAPSGPVHVAEHYADRRSIP